MLTVQYLMHGGIMANYQCTAACRHCLYACSPERTGGYITKDTAESVCSLLRAGGCHAVHIGGGEPFLDFDGLLELVKTITEAGIAIEYIETNAYWAADKQRAVNYIDKLAYAGVDTLCISLDPFHAEYIPIGLPLTLASLCRNMGFGFFLWQDKYLPMLSQLDTEKTHTRTELERLLSAKYILQTALNYGLHYGGRAISIEEEYSPRKKADTLMTARPCKGLLSGGHFHVDLHGKYIPPGCTGIAIPLEEAVRGIPDGNYPIFEKLITGGTDELLRYAVELGFEPDPKGYPSGCALCFYIRNWLSEHAPSLELYSEHYREALKHW